MKKAEVVPIYKNSDKHIASNYRPVSLLLLHFHEILKTDFRILLRNMSYSVFIDLH